MMYSTCSRRLVIAMLVTVMLLIGQRPASAAATGHRTTAADEAYDDDGGQQQHQQQQRQQTTSPHHRHLQHYNGTAAAAAATGIRSDAMPRYVVNPNSTDPFMRNMLDSFNMSRRDFESRTNQAMKNRFSEGTQRPGTELERQKLKEIKDDILESVVNRNVALINPIEAEATTNGVAYFPICSGNNNSAMVGNNTVKMVFSTAIFQRLQDNVQLDNATLRLFQKVQSRNGPRPNCGLEPMERIFITVSVLVRRVTNGEVHFIKRDCDTISRNVNIKHGAWMELDVIEAVRHWIKANSRQRIGGLSNRSMDLMLMVDVRDQDRNELNASQYFEQTDCQAYQTPIPWALVDHTGTDTSDFATVQQSPRLDLITREFFRRPSRLRSLPSTYADGAHRLDQLRSLPHSGRHSSGHRQRGGDHHHSHHQRQRKRNHAPRQSVTQSPPDATPNMAELEQ